MAGRADAIKTYLPDLYADESTLHGFADASGPEFDMMRAAIEGVLAQVFAPTATWALETWERELGLPIAPRVGDDERRSRVVARLRAHGTATHERIRTVANSFANGEVVVIEDYAAYRVTLRFADVRGEPLNLGAVEAAIRTVLPAHLALVTERIYTTWVRVDALRETWDQFDARALTWDQLPTYA